MAFSAFQKLWLIIHLLLMFISSIVKEVDFTSLHLIKFEIND